jgi:hypothetical protein
MAVKSLKGKGVFSLYLRASGEPLVEEFMAGLDRMKSAVETTPMPT